MACGPGFRNLRLLRVRVDVTRTSAVLQLADVVFHSVEGLVVALGLECAGVTPAATGPIGRKLPGGLLRVGGMARRALWSAAMIAGVFG